MPEQQLFLCGCLIDIVYRGNTAGSTIACIMIKFVTHCLDIPGIKIPRDPTPEKVQGGPSGSEVNFLPKNQRRAAETQLLSKVDRPGPSPPNRCKVDRRGPTLGKMQGGSPRWVSSCSSKSGWNSTLWNSVAADSVNKSGDSENKFNKNGDGIASEAAVAIKDYFVHKPTNIEHDRDRIVGHIVSAGFSRYDNSAELMSDDEALITEGAYNIALAAVVYKTASSKEKTLPCVRIELTTFRLWDWRAAYCDNKAWLFFLKFN